MHNVTKWAASAALAVALMPLVGCSERQAEEPAAIGPELSPVEQRLAVERAIADAQRRASENHQQMMIQSRISTLEEQMYEAQRQLRRTEW